MIVFCCVLPASNKARDDDDERTIKKPTGSQFSLLHEPKLKD